MVVNILVLTNTVMQQRSMHTHADTLTHTYVQKCMIISPELNYVATCDECFLYRDGILKAFLPILHTPISSELGDKVNTTVCVFELVD